MTKKKTKAKVTPAGAVEITEEDLDQAAGGAAYVKMPTDQTVKTTSTVPTDSFSLNYTSVKID